MRIIIILITVLMILASCKDKDKYELIKRLLENPEQTEQIIKSSKFKYGHYINVRFDTANYKTPFISEFTKKIKNCFKNKEFSIEYDFTTTLSGFNRRIPFLKRPIHIIKIRGDSDCWIEFEWMYDVGEWYLYSINYY
jgi:hypothetical protein